MFISNSPRHAIGLEVWPSGLFHPDDGSYILALVVRKVAYITDHSVPLWTSPLPNFIFRLCQSVLLLIMVMREKLGVSLASPETFGKEFVDGYSTFIIVTSRNKILCV